MANTTNYNWETPDDTDLVKDGAAAIRTLGSSIDTTTKNLNPETTLGDLAYRSATANVKTRLALGSAGQVLRVNSGGTAPEWATTADQTPLTTKGDLFGYDTADARIPIGTTGHILTADSTQSLGLKWAAPASGGGLTQLETGTLSGASVTTASLSTSYKHLQIVLRAYEPVNDGADLLLRFNGNSSNDYTDKTSGGDLAFTRASHNECFVLQDNSVNTGLAVLTVWDYANTDTLKVLQRNFQSSNLSSNTANMYMTTGVLSTFNSTAAITTLTFLAASGNMNAGTYIIYGVS